ncbi:hypothetical protein ACHAWF_003944 [Thalassiosira exigua]
MMTGQILGGQSPTAAASYQIMIYFAIAASSCATAMLLSAIVTARMFDLHQQALVPWRLIPGLRESSKSRTHGESDGAANPQSKPKFRLNGQPTLLEKESEPLLRVQQLTVHSTNLTIPLLEVKDGDRIGISGRSGVGKSQLLRTIARLDPLADFHKTIHTRDVLVLEGKSWYEIPPAKWRSQVMWVSQDRPTVSGTPRELYNQILSYKSQRQQRNRSETECNQNLKMPYAPAPFEIAQQWNVPAEAWDKPWNDISGGEAQRLSLAIALALEPRLLLLDEPTSSCDANATAKIEHSLIERNVTSVMISHSQNQLRRFCTSTIELY